MVSTDCLLIASLHWHVHVHHVHGSCIHASAAVAMFGVGIKRGTWNGMERGMEYGMERQTLLFSLRTAVRKEWRAVVECEKR